jgi:hypothetical protein
VRRCEVDKSVGLRRFVWNLNSDPGITFSANNQVIQGAAPAGGRGAGAPAGAGAQADTNRAATTTTPGPTLQSCTAPAPQGGFGGGGRGGANNGVRVPNGIYRAQLGRMVNGVVTPVGPIQSFEVKALLEPQPW